MGPLLFVLRRMRRHWQILLVLALGAVLATAMLVSGPLLLDTIAATGLQLTLESETVPHANLRLTAAYRGQPGSPGLPGVAELDSEVQTLLAEILGQQIDRVVLSLQSPWFYPAINGVPASDTRLRIQSYEGIEQQVELVAGRWPTGVQTEEGVLRVAIPEAMARAMALRVGDRLSLGDEPDSTEPAAWIEVAAVARPRNPLDSYWFGEFSPLASQSTERWAGQYSAIVPETSFDAALTDGGTELSPSSGAVLPMTGIEVAWHAFMDHKALEGGDVENLLTQFASLEARLKAVDPPVTLETEVPRILDVFERQLDSIRVPLYILVAEVMLLVLYYVIMVSALAIRQAEREFAILRSRGASGWQIVRTQVLEASIIVALVLLIGPWVGTLLVQGLSWIGPLADLGDAGWSMELGRAAWAAAIAGAVACFLGLLLPLGPALRRSIVTHQRAVGRSTRPPWWQRYYVDVLVLVGALILLWRLRLYGGMVSGGPGQVRLDWLLLLAPVALLLGAATILLRLFPVILGVVAAFLARGRGLAAPMALWQASRNPTHVTRLVLLLTLAIALGTLSTGLNMTLDQSESDRAYYLAGRDLRLASEGAVPLVDLQAAEGVAELSAVWRGSGKVGLDVGEEESPGVWIPPGQRDTEEEDESDVKDSGPKLGFEMLAIEPMSFSQVATFRDDFAEEKMESLLGELVIEEGEHPALMPLPGQPAAFGLWLWGASEDKAAMDSGARAIDGDNDAQRVGVVAKLQTAQGDLFTVVLQREVPPGEAVLQTDRLDLHLDSGGRDVALRFRMRPANDGWFLYQGPVPTLPASSYPLSLHSLWFQNQARRLGEPTAKGMMLVADDFFVTDGETGLVAVVEDFEGKDRPLFLNAMDAGSMWYGLITYMIGEIAHSGDHAQFLGVSYTRPLQTYPLRLRQTWTKEPVPALASPGFVESTQLQVGDLARVQLMDNRQRLLAEVDLQIKGEVRLFPTMYREHDAGYVVTSRDLLLALLNDAVQLPTNPNEAFILTNGSTSVESLSSLVTMLSESWEAESVRTGLKANPLALGLRSVTYFGSVLMIVLSLVGFGTYFYMTIRQREMMYGVMRALGMSSRQMYASIVIEQAVLILAGLSLGTVLGVLLNQVTLSRLPVSLGDQPPVPPFVPREDWLAVGLLYLGLVLAFMFILGIVTALLWRARVHRVLRIGQE